MKFKVLITAPYFQPVVKRFSNEFEKYGIEIIVPPVEERMEEEELIRYISDVDGVICGDDRFTERVLSKSKRLKVISKWGTGIDSIDKEACKRLGIKVCNTPNAFSEPVADSVMGYILVFARRLLWMNDDMRKGIWKKIPGVSLRECTLGIIGVGNVGKAVARRAVSFGMNVIGNDIVQMPLDFLTQTKIKMVSKEELLKLSDFVSLNCDLNPTSYHLIGKKELSLMKSTAFLINTARGPIVDEKELVLALKYKKIAGAALDVFEKEPLPKDSELLKIENVLLAPHNANSSPASWEMVHKNTLKNLLDVLLKR